LSLATPKLATSQIAAVHLWVQASWSKRPGSPGSGGASPYRAGVNKNGVLTPGISIMTTRPVGAPENGYTIQYLTPVTTAELTPPSGRTLLFDVPGVETPG
jgi:hypothetical protein